jgi:hypothetical protein
MGDERENIDFWRRAARTGPTFSFVFPVKRSKREKDE